MNYFDFQPEDLPDIPRYELKDWRQLVQFMKDVYTRVFTDPPVRPPLPADLLERFRWHRHPPRPDPGAPPRSMP